MGDGHHGAGEFGEKAFEPGNAFGVEMVRRLIEQQHIRIRQEQGAQRYAPPFATGEGGYFCFPRRQPQRIGGYFKRAIDLPAVGRVDLGLQIALPFEQRVHLIVAHRLCKLLRNLVELVQRRHHFTHAELDAGANVQRLIELRLLGQIAYFDAFLRPCFAIELLILTRHDPQQTRLPRAI